MKYTVAIAIVLVALASAEPPNRGGVLARQQAAEQPPYPLRNLRPSGPAFNLPLRSQKQQQPPIPAASYGPPSQEYGPPAEVTTTETPTTTETVETTTLAQAENIRASPTNQKLTNAPQNKQINPASFYVVVPQTQNLLYANAPLTSAKLVSQVQQPRLLPVQAVPAFAKIQEVPYIAQYQAVAAPYTAVPASYSAVPAISSAYTSVVSTPFSYSFVQNFQ